MSSKGSSKGNVIGNGKVNAPQGDSPIYDWLTANGGYNQVLGTTGADTLTYADPLLTSVTNDVFVGGAGDDVMDGGEGLFDTVDYSSGSAKKVTVDLVAGTAKGEGNDTLINIENVIGSKGSDSITGSASDNMLDGGNGNDKLVGNGGNDTLYGGAGNDSIVAGFGNDYIDAGVGNDNINAGDGDNDIYAGVGNDRIVAGLGNDYIDAGVGNDNIAAGDGDNEIYAGAGNDRVVSGAGEDLIHADDGNDNVTAGAGDDTVYAGAGNDRVTGDAGNDWLYGEAGKDNLIGGDGDDILDGGSDADNLSGGLGNDTYYVDTLKDRVVEKAGEGEDTVVSSFSYSLAKLANVENLTLSGDADINATGNASDNVLVGNSGDNVLDGLAGNDILVGGLGADTLIGGAGNDTFVFDNLGVGGIDTIKDFTSGSDLLQLDSTVFAPLTALGGVQAGNLVIGDSSVGAVSAADADDYLLFDANTGILSFDADGSGLGAAVEIAQVGVASLSATDFVVV
ncbi:calcium-binding protein [Azotobacter bryophylli]|uniref:Calcium-binding protein n=1 Tax=Azotobacter bryophylli TaxID=1986537 RepID=A0ABV7AP89_9GAMM